MEFLFFTLFAEAFFGSEYFQRKDKVLAALTIAASALLVGIAALLLRETSTLWRMLGDAFFAASVLMTLVIAVRLVFSYMHWTLRKRSPSRKQGS